MQRAPRYKIEGLVANALGFETFIFGRFLLYVPTTAPYKPPSQPMRAPHMWGVERDPRASLGTVGGGRIELETNKDGLSCGCGGVLGWGPGSRRWPAGGVRAKYVTLRGH